MRDRRNGDLEKNRAQNRRDVQKPRKVQRERQSLVISPQQSGKQSDLNDSGAVSRGHLSAVLGRALLISLLAFVIGDREKPGAGCKLNLESTPGHWNEPLPNL